MPDPISRRGVVPVTVPAADPNGGAVTDTSVVEVRTTPAVPAVRPGSTVIDEIERTRTVTTPGTPPPIVHTTTVGGGRTALDVRLDALGGEVGVARGGARGSVAVDSGGVVVAGGVVDEDASGRDAISGRARVRPDGTTDVSISGERVRRDDAGSTSLTTTVEVDGDGDVRARAGIAIARRGTDGVWRTFDGRGDLHVDARGANGSVTVRSVTDGTDASGNRRARTVDASVTGRTDASGSEARGRVTVTTTDDTGTRTVDAVGVISNRGASGEIGRSTTGTQGSTTIRAAGGVTDSGGRASISGSRTTPNADGGSTRTDGDVGVVVDARGVTVEGGGSVSVNDADGDRVVVGGRGRVNPDNSVVVDARTEVVIVDGGSTTTVSGTAHVDVDGEGHLRRAEVAFDARTTDGRVTNRIHGRAATNVVDGASIFDSTIGAEHVETLDDGSLAYRAGLVAHVDDDGLRSRGTLRRERTVDGRSSLYEISSDGEDLSYSTSHTSRGEGRSRSVTTTGTLTTLGAAGRVDVDASRGDRHVSFNVRGDLDGTNDRSILGFGGRRETEHHVVDGDFSVDAGPGSFVTRGQGSATRRRDDGSTTVKVGLDLEEKAGEEGRLGVGLGVEDRVIEGRGERIDHADLQARHDSVVVGLGRTRTDRETGNSFGADGRVDLIKGTAGARATTTRVDGPDRRTHTGTVEGDAKTLRATYRFDHESPEATVSNAVGVVHDDDVSSVHVVRTMRVGEDVGTTDGRFAFRDGGTDVSIAHRHGLKSNGRMLSIGFAVGRTTSLRVRDEGAMSGGPLDKKKRVVVEASHGKEAGVGGGVRLGIAHVGGGMQGRQDHDVAWVTHLDDDRAARAVREPGSMQVPDVSKPDAIAVGDAITVRTTGEVECSLDLSVLGLGVRGRTTAAGVFTFVVEKVTADRVRVTLSPIEVRSLSVEGSAIVLRASIEGVKAESLSQTFDLDLTTEAGRAAYARALDGKMPEVALDTRALDVDAQLGALDRVNATLPEGVRAVRAVTEDTRRTTSSVGLSWAFLSVGHDTHHTRTARTTITDARVETDLETRRESVKRTWFSGTESKGAFSAIAHVSTRGPDSSATTEFKSIALGARVSDSEVEGKDLGHMLRVLNDTLGLPIEAPNHRGTGEARTIDVNLAIDAQGLSSLTQRAIDALEDAARESGASASSTRALMRQLTKQPSPADRAVALERYVADEGLRGLGALVRAFRQIEVVVTASETGDEKKIGEAEAAMARHTGAIAAGDAEAFLKRFVDLEAHQRTISTAKDAVATDPFLAEDRRKVLLERIGHVDRTLDALLDVSGWSRWQKMKAVATLSMGSTLATDATATAAIRYLNHGEPQD